MTKIERVLRELSDLYEFNCRLQEWKKRATIHDPLADGSPIASNESTEPSSERTPGGAPGQEPR